jgi:hypothetical protein
MDVKEIQRIGCQIWCFLAFILFGIPMMLLGLGAIAAALGAGR